MNLRTVTIIVAIAIPIIVVVFICLQDYLEEEPEFEKCGDDESCVRFCCGQNSPCDVTFDMRAHDIAGKLNDTYRIIKNEPCKRMFPVDSNGSKLLEVNE
jgi:hypothetical protein